MTFGEYRRAKPRLNVLRGWSGNEPHSLTHSAKPKSGETIYSGQLMIINSDGEWEKATATNGVGKIPYFAYSDAIWVNSKLTLDTDVASSGLLLGLSCLGDFEIQTAYFDSGAQWVHGSPATYSSTAGQVDLAANLLAATEVIGFATRAGIEDIVKINSEATPDSNGQVLVLNLVTQWRPKSA
jgi:hypothetical protein